MNRNKVIKITISILCSLLSILLFAIAVYGENEEKNKEEQVVSPQIVYVEATKSTPEETKPIPVVEEVNIIETKCDNNNISEVSEATESENDYIPQNCYTSVFENMTDEEYQEFAKSLWMEAGNASKDCMIATCEVYLNRTLLPGWGDGTTSVYAVIHEKGQFETTRQINDVVEGKHFYWKGKYDWGVVHLKDVYDTIEYCRQNGNTLLPGDYVFFGTGKYNGRDFIKIGRHYFSRS